ncbi:MAG: VWA domain-containing protein, partial [Pseudodonghicola sp.]
MPRIRLPHAAAALAAGLWAGLTPMQAPAQGAETNRDNVMIVFDGSNSMWGQIDGVAKIEIARGVMANLLGGWTDGRAVGLMAYGHRRRGDCTDIETLIEPAPGTRAAILDRIGAITPTGKTPLTDAVEQAARVLSYADRPATVILISDGLESCERDPCALAEALERGGVGFTAHVVGFGLGADEDSASLACIAERTGGQYIQAGNAEELGRALSAVGDAVAQAPAAEPVKAPEPAPEPALPQITLTGPDTALTGQRVDIGWAGTTAAEDYVTVVPAGAAEGAFTNYVHVRQDNRNQLRMPAQPGLYELRYVVDKGGRTAAARPIEILTPEITLTGPDSAMTGSEVPVSWTGAVDAEDYVTIVAMGAVEGSHGSYANVRGDSQAMLQAPAEPGMYELRYVLSEGARTMASRPIEITEPQVALTGPDSAQAGSKITVGWTGTVNGQDYITIVPMGAEEGSSGNYRRVRDQQSEELQAPAEPGMYELRYVLEEGGRTMASRPIEITEPQVTVRGPESAQAGSKFTVSWAGAVSGEDYVTIVPMGAEEGSYTSYRRVRALDREKLQAPADPGHYELRYVLEEGGRTMARQPIEITEPQV